MRLGKPPKGPLEAYFHHCGSKEFPLPHIAGTFSGNLVICGDGKCIWDDLKAIGCSNTVGRGNVSRETTDFLVINKLGETFPGFISHWYSNNARSLPQFLAARREEYEFPRPAEFHSCNRGFGHQWPLKGSGTSGLSAILVGLGLGYDKIEVCGMPLDDSPHNGEPPWRRSNFGQEVADTVDGKINRCWKSAIKYAFEGKVSFVSGRAKAWME